MYKNKTISVILPAYNEEKGIKKAIDSFSALGIIDEIIVVDNNSTDKTASIIKKTKAVYTLEKNQGYGNALIRGLKEAKYDIILMCEPDGSFEAKDIYKFLAYIDDSDVVFGSRTSKTLIWDNAKMDHFLRIGNVVVAKFLEYLFNGPCLTDVGCTMKMIKKNQYKKIKNNLKVGESWFSPDFMIECIKNKLICVEIPINYKERIGDSKITSSFWKSFKLGLKMIMHIIKKRVNLA